MTSPSDQGPGGPTFAQAAYAGGAGGNYSRSGQVELSGNSSAYQAAMGAASHATQGLLAVVVDLFTHVDQLFKLGGRSLKIVAAGDVALLAHAADNAGDLQAQMSTLHATAEVNRTSFNAYGKTVDSVFSNFPSHRSDVVALVTEITNLGVKGKAIDNVATSMEKLGAASGDSIPQLANDLVLLNRQMGGTGATNIAGYANEVLTLSKNAGTSVSSITSFAQAIAPISRLAGINQSAVLGISTAFSKAGADGYYAANTFNSILNDITVATKTGSPDLAKYASFVGVTVGHFRKMPAKEQITGIFDAIAKGGPRALNFMNELGLGTRGLTAVQAVAQQGGLRRFISEGERSSHGTGNLDRGANAALNGLDAAAGRLHNQFTRFEDLLGGPMLSVLTPLTRGFTTLLSGVNGVVSHLGPLPTLLAALAPPLSLIAGIGLTHAGVVAGIATARMFVNPGTSQSFVAGRQTQMLLRGGMASEEAMLATGVGAAMAGSGRNLMRTRVAYGLGRVRGRFDPAAASMDEAALATETAAGASLLNRGAGGLIGRAMRFPAWLLNTQTNTVRDAQASTGLGRSAYKGTAEAEGKAAAAVTKVATAEERQATVVGSLSRGTWNLVKAFADLAVETAKYSVVLAKQGTGMIGKGASTSVTNRAVNAEAAALNRLKMAETERAAATQRATSAVAASHEAEAAVVGASLKAEEVQLTRMQALRARTFGMIPSGTLGKAFGVMMLGQLAGSMVDNGQQGSIRNRTGTAISDAGIGGALGSFLPGFGPYGLAAGAVLGGLYGLVSSRPRPEVAITPPTISAFAGTTANTGTTGRSFAALKHYLDKTRLHSALKNTGDDPYANMGEDKFLQRMASDPRYRDMMLQLLSGPGTETLTGNERSDIRGAFKNYTAGVERGQRRHQATLDAVAAASPLSNALTGTNLFKRVSYGDLSGNVGAQSKVIEQTAQTAVTMTGSAGKASAELQKLADAAGGAAGQLLQNSAAYARMLQGFNLGYESRGQRLSTLTDNALRSRRIAMAPGATDYDKTQATNDQNALAQEKQSYTQYLQSVFTAVREFHVSQVRAEQDYNTSVFRSQRNFQIQMQQSEHDYLLSRSRQLQDFNIQMARQAESAAESIYSPFQTVQVQQVVNGGMLVGNLEDQNRRIEQQSRQLAQLRHAGLSQQAIDVLRLSDPNNAQQTNSIAQSVINDPKTIAQINKLVGERKNATTALVQSQFNEDFRNTVADFQRGLSRAATDYNTSRDRAVQAQKIALGDMATDFTKMVTRSGEDLTRQMTELYGNFAQNYTRTLAEINKDIGKAVPALEKTLVNEITSAEGRVAAAANGGVDAGGGNPAPVGSAGNPIGTPNTLGINPQGQIGSYTSGGKFVPYKGYVSPSEAASLQHISNPKNATANTPQAAQDYARGLLSSYGWGSGQMSALMTLWNNESGWRWDALNNSSGAYGIPQALPGSKMSTAGADWHDNGATQIRWGLGYIKGRYGSPSKALNFWENIAPLNNGSHWYHSGGVFTGRQVIGVGDVPQGEQVLPLDGRGTNFMVSFYDRVTTALAQRLASAGGGQPGLRGMGSPTMVHEDYRTIYTGNIEVKADDAATMERKLAARQRLKRLATPARARG